MQKDNLSGEIVQFFFGSNNLVGIISIEDADLVELPWGKSNGYAMGCQNNGYKGQMMHRIILERMIGRKLNRQEFTDHINRTRSDNQRCNLRLSDNSKNQLNKASARKNITGYKGVHFDSHAFRKGWPKCYKSSITVNGNSIYLGLFDNPLDAALTYDKAAKKYFGKLAQTNF